MTMINWLWVRSTIAAFACVLAFGTLPAWSAQTVHLSLTVDGNLIEGDSTVVSMDRENTIECLSYNEEVHTSRDPVSGALTGRRVYLPITITKRIDRSSPLLQRALAANESVDEAVFRFYRPNPIGDGTTQQYFTVKLENGYVSSIRRIVPDVLDPVTASRPAMEEVSFVFQAITWVYEPNGTQHHDASSEAK